jgi:DNA ligase (NAD+)
VLREGAYTFCPAGLSCRAQLIGHILHYAARYAMNIEGLGEKIAAQLVDREMVKDVADLYALEVDDLLKLEGFAEKSAENLHRAIRSAMSPRLDRFLLGLGIPHVGQHVARVLAEKYRSLEKLESAAEDDIHETPGVGPEIASSVAEFFAQERNRAVLRKIREAGVVVEAMPEEKRARSLEGKTFVFTGELAGLKRSEAQEIVTSLGGRAASSVSKATDYVVVGENPGSKYDDAKRLGVTVLSLAEFSKLVGRTP